MKPIDQTTFGVPNGNCFCACVASILEIGIEEVPHVMGADNWLVALADWLRPRGLYPVHMRIATCAEDVWRPEGLYIMGGQSKRGPHAVVARGPAVVHDPHWSRDGLLTQEDATLLVHIDPARDARRRAEDASRT